jgi:sugar O-acyltransferase (sialic acid O-acetyltransferase NeuD family)
MKQVVIFGAGGHAVSVANVVIASGAAIKCFVDQKKAGQELFGHKIIANAVSFSSSDVYYAIAVADNSVRGKIFERIAVEIPKDRFINFIHPTASVGINAKLGYGNVVMPNATIGPRSVLEDFCIINTNASIDHDCIMESFSSMAPGAHAGGNVKLGLRSAISIGALVKHGIVVGNDAIVGAASYVNVNISGNSVVYGVPAKLVQQRRQGDLYLR